MSQCRTTELHTGTAALLVCRFADDEGFAIDPTQVVASILKPNGNTTSYTYGTDPEITREATGKYSVQVVPASNEAGVWYYRFEGSGNIAAADEGSFTVVASMFG